MNDRRTGLVLALAFGGLCLILGIIVVPFAFAPNFLTDLFVSDQDALVPVNFEVTSEPVPTFTLQPQGVESLPTPMPGQVESLAGLEEISFEYLYDQVSPGVVSIQVLVEQGGVVGGSSGSGFVLNREGYIVTNNHVVDGATLVSVIFFDGYEAPRSPSRPFPRKGRVLPLDT